MNLCDKPGDIGERGCMTSTSSGPIWWHGSCSALLRRLAFAGHFKDGGRALLHLTDLQNLRKNPIFLRDLIPSDCAPALSKITLRGSGGAGRQPTFGGQHHLCLISFGVGFIFTLKRYNLLFDNLDPLQWLLQRSIMYCKRQFKAPNDLPTQWPRSLLINCRFQIQCKKKGLSGKCLMEASTIYWKVEIGKFGNNLTISFGNFGNNLWTQNQAVGTKSFGRLSFSPLVQFQS